MQLFAVILKIGKVNVLRGERMITLEGNNLKILSVDYDKWCIEVVDLDSNMMFNGTYAFDVIREREKPIKVVLYHYTAKPVDKPIEEVVKENEQLKETIKELELENAKHIGDGEWDNRDITYRHGKFRLEEWGNRYHQFYDDDKPLEDEEVVSLLFENEQLKQKISELKCLLELAKLHTEVAEGKTDKFVELKLND